LKTYTSKVDYRLYRENIGYHREDWIKAMAEYDGVLEIKPAHHTANFKKGMCLLKLHKQQEAIPFFDAAILAKPRYTEALAERGVAKLNLGDSSGCDDLRHAKELGEKSGAIEDLLGRYCE